MSRPVILLVVILVAIAGGLYWLAGRASEQPTTRVEKQVSLANLQ